MNRLQPFHAMLKAACAIHAAKERYANDPAVLEEELEKFERYKLLKPHILQIRKRLEEVRAEVEKSHWGKTFTRDGYGKPIAVGPNIVARLVADADPRKAHHKGIQALSGKALKDYRAKRRRQPPGFTAKEFTHGAQLQVLPWGVHATFGNPSDYKAVWTKGSGGMAYPGDLPYSFSTDNAEHVMHETDHSFFHTIFPKDHPLDLMARMGDYHYVASRIPTFLEGKQREQFDGKIVSALVENGYTVLRNEGHSYLGPLAQWGRVHSGSRFSWRLFRRVPYRRLEALLKTEEFKDLADTRKQELRQWLRTETRHLAGLLRKNGDALDASDIPRHVLSKLMLFVPYYKIHKFMPFFNQAYAQRKTRYEKIGNFKHDAVAHAQWHAMGKLEKIFRKQARKDKREGIIEKGQIESIDKLTEVPTSEEIAEELRKMLIGYRGSPEKIDLRDSESDKEVEEELFKALRGFRRKPDAKRKD